MMPHLGHWFSFCAFIEITIKQHWFHGMFVHGSANGCAIAFAHHSLYISIFWLGIILKSLLNDLSTYIIKIHLHI
jgi:hypothetical protein